MLPGTLCTTVLVVKGRELLQLMNDIFKLNLDFIFDW